MNSFEHALKELEKTWEKHDPNPGIRFDDLLRSRQWREAHELLEDNPKVREWALSDQGSVAEKLLGEGMNYSESARSWKHWKGLVNCLHELGIRWDDKRYSDTPLWMREPHKARAVPHKRLYLMMKAYEQGPVAKVNIWPDYVHDNGWVDESAIALFSQALPWLEFPEFHDKDTLARVCQAMSKQAGAFPVLDITRPHATKMPAIIGSWVEGGMPRDWLEEAFGTTDQENPDAYCSLKAHNIPMSQASPASAWKGLLKALHYKHDPNRGGPGRDHYRNLFMQKAAEKIAQWEPLIQDAKEKLSGGFLVFGAVDTDCPPLIENLLARLDGEELEAAKQSVRNRIPKADEYVQARLQEILLEIQVPEEPARQYKARI